MRLGVEEGRHLDGCGTEESSMASERGKNEQVGFEMHGRRDE